MFTEYLGEVPQTQEELEGTPYLETQDIADNLEDNGCVHYRDTLDLVSATQHVSVPALTARTAEHFWSSSC